MASAATFAIRAEVPLEMFSDIIELFPSFSTIFDLVFKTLRRQIAIEVGQSTDPG